MAGMLPYAGVSFWAHDFVGDILRAPALAKYSLSPVAPRNEREARHPKLKNQWEAVAGGLAGLMAQTSSYPIEVVRRRMQVGGAVGNKELKGFWQTVRSVYATGGVKGFYVGLSIGYFKVCHPHFWLVCAFVFCVCFFGWGLTVGCSDGVVFFCGVGADEALVGLELDWHSLFGK